MFCRSPAICAIVLLALPLAHGNGGNLGQGEQTERPLRYRQEWQKVQDIYGSDSEDMAVERHALSLRFAHDNNQDYITCPLARLVRDVQGNWTQDESYIPPLLAFNAHDGLVQRLDTLLLQLRAKCQRLMAMRRESNQRMADFAVADVSLFWLLNALNSAEPVLSDFLRYPAVHPELVWRELARLAGALLTFSLEHNVSAVPPYVHESPSIVFPPLFSLLSELLEASLPSRVIALDLASLPGNRWKADLHDPRLREDGAWLAGKAAVPTDDATNDVLALEPEALAMADSQGVEAALGWIQTRPGITTARQRLLLRLLMARVAEQYGKNEMALLLLEELDTAAQGITLTQWEPELLFEVKARQLKLLRLRAHRYADKALLNRKMEILLGTLVAIDPVRAAVLCDTQHKD